MTNKSDHDKTKEELIDELQQLREANEKLRKSEETYRSIIDGMNDTMWVIGLDGNFIDVNDSAAEVLGYSREELISMSPYDIDDNLSPEAIKGLIENMPIDETQTFETAHTTKDGKQIPVEIKSSLVNYHGKRAILSIARDITARKNAEENLKQLLEELSTPVLYAWEGIIVMPLVGTLTSDRAREAMETLLKSINERKAEVAIIDITGVSVIDSMVADSLGKTVKAVKTLGSEAIVTGVSAEIASTMVEIGTDVDQFITKSTLQSGLQYAISSIEENFKNES